MAQRGDGVVHVRDIPVRLFLESQDHQHDLVRELQLIEIADRFELGSDVVSAELARLISGILTQYGAVRSATRAQALAALDRGDEVVDLEVPIAPGMAGALRAWIELLEEADRQAATGDLLVLASRPEVRALRRRYVEEITSCLDS